MHWGVCSHGPSACVCLCTLGGGRTEAGGPGELPAGLRGTCHLEGASLVHTGAGGWVWAVGCGHSGAWAM